MQQWSCSYQAVRPHHCTDNHAEIKKEEMLSEWKFNHPGEEAYVYSIMVVTKNLHNISWQFRLQRFFFLNIY